MECASSHRCSRQIDPVKGRNMNTTSHKRSHGDTQAKKNDEQRRFMWRTAHRDWRVWCAAILMIAMILVYVVTNDLSLLPGKRARPPTPEAIAP
jgi:uncharacterized integral membrane protein